MAEDIEHQDIQTQDSPLQEPRPQEQPSDQEQPTRSMPHDEDGDNIDAQHLRELLAALKVDGTWFKKHIPVFLLVFGRTQEFQYLWGIVRRKIVRRS